MLDALRRLVRALRESSRLVEKTVGISGAQLFVLQQLGEGTPLSINELARRTLTHQSSVSVVVSRLVEGGLVKRSANPEDARLLDVALTARGRALVARAPDVEQARFVRGLRRMARADREALQRGLTAWLDAMDLHDQPPSMFFEEPPGAAAPKRPTAKRAPARKRSATR